MASTSTGTKFGSFKRECIVRPGTCVQQHMRIMVTHAEQRIVAAAALSAEALFAQMHRATAPFMPPASLTGPRT